MNKQQVGIRTAVALVTACLIVAAGLALAADPGSKDDPLATVSYVEANAQFNRIDLAAQTSLRLGQKTEMIIVGLQGEQFPVGEFNPRSDTLIDLSDGSLAVTGVLLANHHYINGSEHDLFFRFDNNVTLLIRGEWK